MTTSPPITTADRDKASDNRTCTCHPDERPEPCQHKYAWWDCMKARVVELEAALTSARANIARLTDAPADHRYWEARWRDEAARATALLEALRIVKYKAGNNTTMDGTDHPGDSGFGGIYAVANAAILAAQQDRQTEG